MTARHFLRFLTLLALLFAPLGMIGGHAAMAGAPQAAAGGGHCADMDSAGHEAPADDAPARNIDCTIACACVPGRAALLAAPSPLVTAPAPARPALHSAGRNPAAEPPPPRAA